MKRGGRVAVCGVAAVLIAVSCGDESTLPAGDGDAGEGGERTVGQGATASHGGEGTGNASGSSSAGLGAMSSLGGMPQGGMVGEPAGAGQDAGGQVAAGGSSNGGAPFGSAGQSHGEGGATSAGGAAGAGGQGEIDWCDGSDAGACLQSVAGEESDFGNALHSSWFIATCPEKQGFDCITIQNCNLSAQNWADQGMVTTETFPIGGLTGQRYKLTFSFNAIASAKVYVGGTRDAGDNVPANPDSAEHDSFYRDGSPTETQYDDWKLVVLDPDGQEARHYYMNSFPAGQAYPDGRGYEYHRTYLLSFSKSIVVIGGGSVLLRNHDRNCHAIDNCGAGEVVGDVCTNPRSLPHEPNAVLPAMYRDPQTTQMVPTSSLNIVTGSAAQPWHAQIGHLTVTSVEKTNAAVTDNL